MRNALLALCFFLAVAPSVTAQRDCAGPRHLKEKTRDCVWDIAYPILPGSEAECSVRAWIDQARADFDFEAPQREDNLGERNRFQVVHRVVESPWTRTVILTLRSSYGRTARSERTKTFTFDRRTGDPIGLDDLFEEGKDREGALLAFIRGKFLEEGVESWPDRGLGQDPGAFDRFALEGRDLLLFFEPGKIIPESEGTVEIRIPLKGIGEGLRPRFKVK